MAGNLVEDEAFVSLVTNDNYAHGALVLGYSLRRVNTTRKLVLLVTNQVTEHIREELSRVWDFIETVDPLDSGDDANLAILTRPELGITFTKIRCWNLTQFRKCVFLDADTFVLQNCDELFERQELSAVPDVGWPDCFNSGVFVFEPSRATYEALLQFAIDCGSFDGGDQGLLNSFFSRWKSEDISTHLSFIYNMNSNVSYTYAPAFKKFGKDVKIVHFIGPVKPWMYSYSTSTGTANMPPNSNGLPHERSFIHLWWDIYNTYVLPAMRQCSENSSPPIHQPHYSEPCPDHHRPPPPYIPTPEQFSDSSSQHEHEHSWENVPFTTPHGEETKENVRNNVQEQCPSHDTEEDSHNTGFPDTYNIHQVTEEFTILHLQQHDPNLPTIDEEGKGPQRTAWENGKPDYNGRDSFPNIQDILDTVIGEDYRPIEDVPSIF